MKLLNYVALILVIIGALNYGIFGLAKLDVIELVFAGRVALGARIVYDLIGISGLIALGFFIPLSK